MIALLHYLRLKSTRDRSLAIIVLGPAVVLSAALLGTSVANRQFRYPLTLDPRWDAAHNAQSAALLATLFAVIFGSISAFATLREEVATRSVASLVLASRPSRVVAALVAYSSATALVAWILATAMAVLLTGAVPQIFAVTPHVVLTVLAATAISTLAVTISPQPQMLVWAFAGSAVLLLQLHSMSMVPLGAAIAAAICTGAAAFFLERRCAS